MAFLTYIAKNYPSLQVPRVYAYNLKHSGLDSPYIAMEFIEGEPLDAAWGSLSEASKETITDDIAQIIVEMGDINLGGIGSLTLEHSLGPTVEGVKLFRGRVGDLNSKVECFHPLTAILCRRNSTRVPATTLDRTKRRLITR